MNPNILGPGGLVVVKDCIVDWNVQSLAGASGIGLIGSDSAYSVGSPGPWWIEGNQILPASPTGGGYSAAAVVDIGDTSNLFGHAWIVGNIFRNCKIRLINADDIWICRNTHVIDSTYNGPTDAAFITTLPATGTASPIGEIHVEENSILDLMNSGASSRSQTKLNLQRNGYARSLFIHRNQIYYSSRPTGGGSGVIRVSTISPNTTGWGVLSICDNVFGCVDKSGTLLPAIHIDGIAAAVFDRIMIRGSRGIGVGPSSAILPATVAGGYTYLLDVGLSMVTLTGTDLTVEDNDLGASTSFTTKWYNPAGSTTFSRTQWRKNYPREPNDTAPVGAGTSTYTHGTTNLTTAAHPSTGPANATYLGGNTGAGGSITLNGAPILGGGTAYNITLLLMIGDVVTVITGGGGTVPALFITPSASSM
jgi:hypothetical protein